MTDTINALGSDTLPVHERVANAVEAVIASGRYRAGDKLPTHRALAQQFSVSIGSVTRAIDTLSARGVVSSEVGRGTFVRQVSAAPDSAGVIDLSINAPPLLITPEQLAEASALANERALRLAHGGYGDFTGSAAQRGAVAGWLGERRCPMSADAMVLTNGAQQSLHLAFSVLRDTVKAVVTEGVSFPGAIAAAANAGIPMLPVERDGEGPLPEALARVLEQSGPVAVYLTPVCQNPLGYEMGQERRAALARVVADTDSYIVEDDIYGVYSTQAGPLFRELLPQQTFYVTSFSKSLTPLIRMGVLVPPDDFLTPVKKRMRAESWGLPPYVAELGAALIEMGAADTALSVLRGEAQARIALTQDILGLSGLPMPEGAPHVWLALDPLRAEQLSRRAIEAGVRLGPPGAMRVGLDPVAGVRLCIMAPANRVLLEKALRILARLLVEEEEVLV